ncbi:hypothetical protein EIMP300_49620 [Escherichia coli]|uniref:Phospho-2-dehydro-3-deoxyheptonate aldolase, Trp-sensitive n=1 Tax=Escherichia coli TaxID=562 RepID=A0A8S0FTP5_ECOLX|nr:hypothetical protein EIMP300_49620 [Escherichia coli]
MFLSPDKNGQMTIYQTSGNPYGHIIMRGGKKPNYHADDIAAACDTLHEFDLPEHLVVDFSHGNCQKQHRRQLEVCEDICQQIRNGSTAIAGIMAESFLREGTLRRLPELWRKVSCAKERKKSSAVSRSLTVNPLPTRVWAGKIPNAWFAAKNSPLR